MSQEQDNEGMEDVSLETRAVSPSTSNANGVTETPDATVTMSGQGSSQDSQPKQVQEEDTPDAHQGGEPSRPAEPTYDEVALNTTEIRDHAGEPSSRATADSQPPPPLPEKDSQFDHVQSPPPQRSSTSTPHRPHPSISVTAGDSGSLYRAGGSANTSSASFSGVPHLSLALIKPGLELIAQSKEAKKNTALLQASQRALELCQKEGGSAQPKDILEPLKLASETHVDRLVTPALDLIAKLVAHGFFRDESEFPTNGPSVADIVTHIITSSYSQSTSPQVAVQVVKSLLAIVMSNTLNVHQSSLLKAVRTVYNVYLLSSDPTTQLVAQGSLTQMIHHIFGRVKRNRNLTRPHSLHTRSASSVSTPIPNGTSFESGHDTNERSRQESPRDPADQPNEHNTKANMTLESFSAPNPNDSIPLDVSANPAGSTNQADGLLQVSEELNPDLQAHESAEQLGKELSREQLHVKDAFLVFRALCKLTMTPLLSER